MTAGFGPRLATRTRPKISQLMEPSRHPFASGRRPCGACCSPTVTWRGPFDPSSCCPKAPLPALRTGLPTPQTSHRRPPPMRTCLQTPHASRSQDPQPTTHLVDIPGPGNRPGGRLTRAHAASSYRLAHRLRRCAGSLAAMACFHATRIHRRFTGTTVAGTEGGYADHCTA